MKFKDIKVNDTVLIRKEVSYGLHKQKYFWIPTPVTKVTPKQFEVLNHKFNKADGSMVGGSYGDYVYLEGDMFHSEKITDETTAYSAFNNLVKEVLEIKNLLFKLEGSKSTTPLINADLQDLMTLKKLLQKIASESNNETN